MPDTLTTSQPDLSRTQRHATATRRSRHSTAPRRRSRGRHPVRTTLIVLVALVVAAALAALYVFFLRPNSPSLPQGKEVNFVVAPGATSAHIAADLKQAGLIDSVTVFRFRLARSGSAPYLKAGTHQLTAGYNYDRLILILTQTPSVTAIKVVIPEGSNIDRIAAILQDQIGLSATTFSAYAKSAASDFKQQYPYLESAYNGSLEGYLFPDTYQFNKGSTPQDICAEMLGRFDQVWATLQASDRSNYSTAQLVTVASLVEKEASVPSERPLVASVIYNRLGQSMRLQLCSTVQMLLPDPSKNKLRLTDADLATPSPYNTYLHAGLPPGPITNPGKAALQAAINPAKTSYLYFVLTGKDGSQTFASTSEEFAAAKLKSKEVFGQ